MKSKPIFSNRAGKTKFVLLSVGVLLSAFVAAQAPNWEWAKNPGCLTEGVGRGISHDAAGNVYATGYFNSPTATFGNHLLNGQSNVENIFIVKYDSLGNAVWARTPSGTTTGKGMAIRTDAAGNSYVVGTIAGAGTLSFGSVNISSSGGNSFLAKFDPSGNAVWGTTVAPVGGVSVLGCAPYMALSIDSTGNSYVTGTFFGMSSGMTDSVTLFKFDNLGNLVAKKYLTPGSGSSWANWSAANDAGGNTYLAGYFNGTGIAFEGNPVPNTSNGHLIYVVKYNSAGNVVWAKSYGQYPSLYMPDITVDREGNLYVAGYFNGNSAGFGSVTLANSGMEDVFVVKLDNSGNVLWAKRGGGPSSDRANSIVCDPAGNPYISGFFNISGTFNSTPILGQINDVFVVKYDPAGSVLWTRKAGGNLGENGRCITVNPKNHIFITGEFWSSYPTFGNHTLVNCDTIMNISQIFVAKLGNSSGSATLTAIRENEIDGVSIAILPNPSSQLATLRVIGGFRNGTITLYDASGKQIKQIEGINGPDFQLNHGELLPGIYFVSVNANGTGIKYSKFVISDH